MSWPMCNPCLGYFCHLCLGTAQEPRPTKNGSASRLEPLPAHMLLNRPSINPTAANFPRWRESLPRLSEVSKPTIVSLFRWSRSLLYRARAELSERLDPEKPPGVPPNSAALWLALVWQPDPNGALTLSRLRPST